MKKNWNRFLSILVSFLCLSGLLISPASAQEENAGLYIQSESCPQEATQYAKSQMEHIMIMGNIKATAIQLGTPFVLNNTNAGEKLYYYPVLVNGQILYTYRVYSVESGFNGILSDALVEQLNDLHNKTSTENPARVFVNSNNDIVVTADNFQTVIDSDPTDLPDPLNANEPEASLVQPKAVIDATAPVARHSVLFRAVRGGQKNLNVTIRETQGGEPWCAAYVCALITSYRTGGVYYARDVANFAGVGTSQSVSRSEVVKFAKSKGLSPRETVFDVSSNSLGKQIESGSPVYIGVKNLSNTSSSHALAIVGYSYDGSQSDISGFSVWNPWYNSFDWMGANQIYVNRSGTRYEGESYIINW